MIFHMQSRTSTDAWPAMMSIISSVPPDEDVPDARVSVDKGREWSEGRPP